MTQNVLETLAVSQLNARYCDAVMRRDSDAWRSLWHRKSRWYFLGEWIEGQDAIVERWEAAMSGFPVVYHQINSEMIDASKDEATSRVYIDEEIVTADGDALRFIGVYNDHCVRQGNNWLYLSRRFDMIYQGPGALSQNGWIGYPTNTND
jgi:hypothetical protein